MGRRRKNFVEDRLAFSRPTLEEVREYLKPLHAYFTAETFFYRNEAAGWRLGGHEVYDWKSLVEYWLANRRLFRKAPCQSPQVEEQQQAAQAREAAQQEWERRYEESRQNRVSYEEYKRMKAAGMVS